MNLTGMRLKLGISLATSGGSRGGGGYEKPSITAPDGAYAGAPLTITGGKPVAVLGDGYVILAEGSAILAYVFQFVINGSPVGDWFTSRNTTIPISVVEGDLIQVKDAYGNLSNTLTATDDPDAQAYREEVETEIGGPVTTTQRNALTKFCATEKVSGRWGNHRRVFFPVWGVESANEIDIVTRNRGAFSGGVTHAAGYAEGNGTDGAFTPDILTGDLGLTSSNLCVGAIVFREHQAASYSSLFAGNTDQTGIQILENGSHNLEFYAADNGSPLSITGANGVILASRTGSSARNVTRRTSSGFTSQTDTATATMIVSQSVTGWARAYGTALFGNQRVGGFYMGLGLSVADSEDFSQSLKTLWETVTGLSIP